MLAWRNFSFYSPYIFQCGIYPVNIAILDKMLHFYIQLDPREVVFAEQWLSLRRIYVSKDNVSYSRWHGYVFYRIHSTDPSLESCGQQILGVYWIMSSSSDYKHEYTDANMNVYSIHSND